MRILHVNDRLSRRGGADHYLNALLAHQSQRHTVALLIGNEPTDQSAPCPVYVEAGLAAPSATPVHLARAIDQFAPDVIHINNVMNPTALNELALHRCVMTVQDHRVFCPGRGKWTLDLQVCTRAMSADVCSACFNSEPYFESILSITRARLLAIS